jgi:hypothetical protein
MRKIEIEMLQAIKTGKNWHYDNTMIDVYNDTTRVYLHGNLIAEGQLGKWNQGKLTINWPIVDKWPTNTTCSRLRALGFRVARKDGEVIEYDDNWKAISR